MQKDNKKNGLRTMGVLLASVMVLSSGGVQAVQAAGGDPSEAVVDEDKKLVIVYLNGVSGDDAHAGTSAEDAVKSFSQAVKLAGDYGVIRICGMVTVDGAETWKLPSGVSLRRAEDYSGDLVKVNGSLKLDHVRLNREDITGDGKVEGAAEKEKPAETTPEAAPEATPEAEPETTPEAEPEAAPEAAPEVTPEATPEAEPEAVPEVTPETTPEEKSDQAETPEETLNKEKKEADAVKEADTKKEEKGAAGEDSVKEENPTAEVQQEAPAEAAEEASASSEEETTAEAAAEQEKEAEVQPQKQTDASEQVKITEKEAEAAAKAALTEEEAAAADQVQRQIDFLPTEVNTMEAVEAILDATKAYEALTEEEKTGLSGDAFRRLEDAQKLAGVYNRSCEGVSIEADLPWYVQFQVTLHNEEDDLSILAEQKANTFIAPYDLSLWNLMTDEPYVLNGQQVKVTIPAPDRELYLQLIVVHYREDGSVEYITPIDNHDGTLSFLTTSFSPYNLAGSKVAGSTSLVGNTGKAYKPAKGSKDSLSFSDNRSGSKKQSSSNGSKKQKRSSSSSSRKQTVRTNDGARNPFTRRNPATGDEQPILYYMGLGAGALVVLGVTGASQKKRKKNDAVNK